MKGLLANMWDNKESVVGGVFDIVTNKEEANIMTKEEFMKQIFGAQFTENEMQRGLLDPNMVMSKAKDKIWRSVFRKRNEKFNGYAYKTDTNRNIRYSVERRNRQFS